MLTGHWDGGWGEDLGPRSKRCTWTRAGASLRPLPLPSERLCGSLCLRLCARLGGVGKPEAANQRLGLEKCLEGWTFSLETLAHLERTSLPAQRPSPPGPPLFPPPAHSLSPSLPLGGHLDLVVLAFPQLPVCICNRARAQTHQCSPHPPCGPLTDHLTQLTDS